MKSAYGTFVLFLAFLAGALGALPAEAQEGPLENTAPQGTTPEEIIKRFAAKETEFAKARDQYTYRQDVTVETLDGDTVDGQYHEVFDVMFDPKGKRIENVVFAPQSSLTKIYMSQEDMEDIRHKLPFVLTTDDLTQYNILYVGQQKEDELNCYVFDIAPKQIEGKKRYFQGRVWVDDHDFQIVKTYGKTVPDIRKKHGDEENLFPKFTTWRQQIDGLYWFPVYTKADDELHFKVEDVHIKEIVKYQDYKRFGTNVKILYEGKEIPKADQKKPDDKKPQ
jgi:ABC-type cobalt transport system substrate-binding protein